MDKPERLDHSSDARHVVIGELRDPYVGFCVFGRPVDVCAQDVRKLLLPERLRLAYKILERARILELSKFLKSKHAGIFDMKSHYIEDFPEFVAVRASICNAHSPRKCGGAPEDVAVVAAGSERSVARLPDPFALWPCALPLSWRRFTVSSRLAEILERQCPSTFTR
jgi:hypothetical protein